MEIGVVSITSMPSPCRKHVESWGISRGLTFSPRSSYYGMEGWGVSRGLTFSPRLSCRGKEGWGISWGLTFSPRSSCCGKESGGISRGLTFGPRSSFCGKEGWAVRQSTVLSLWAGSSVETSPASWPVLGFPLEGALGGPAVHLCSVPRLDIPQSA